MGCCLSPITITLDTDSCLERKFCVRKVGSDAYLYQIPKFEWVKSCLLLPLNIVHNIFLKCIAVVLISLFSSLGMKFDDQIEDEVFSMWKGASPIRSLVILIPQILINLAGILTFGFLSHRFNWISGDLERWAVGDTKNDLIHITRNARNARKNYLAICEQPITILSDGISLNFQEKSKLLDVISNDTGRREVYSMMFSSEDFAKNLSYKEWEARKDLMKANCEFNKQLEKNSTYLETA